ncbi:unnamed protein product, partial [Prunus brigantina]
WKERRNDSSWHIFRQHNPTYVSRYGVRTQDRPTTPNATNWIKAFKAPNQHLCCFLFSLIHNTKMGLLQNMQNQNMNLVLSTDAKPALKWTAELHQRFVETVNQLGGADS